MESPKEEILRVVVLVVGLRRYALYKVILGAWIIFWHRVFRHATLIGREVNLTDQCRTELKGLVSI